MGSNISSNKYSMEVAEMISSDNIPVCCSLGDYEYILSDDPGTYLFKEKGESQKWLLYEGLLSEIIIKTNRLYLVPFFDLDNKLLENSSIEFPNFYEMSNYIRKNIHNNMLNIKILDYSRKNIKNNYMNNVDVSNINYDDNNIEL